MSETEDCPDEETLWLLIEGDADPDVAEVQRRHLDRCPACQAVVAALLRGTGPKLSRGSVEPQVGSVVADRFRVIERLGAGAMGVVFRAEDTQLGRDVALKLLGHTPSASSVQAARLLRESKAMASLRHPRVVTVFDAFVDDERLVIAMALYDGGTLRRWTDPVRPWREVCRVMLEAGRGLQAVHDAGWIHRDFKPDNVLLDRDGHAYVADFGLVRAFDSHDMSRVDTVHGRSTDSLKTLTGEGLGTPVYMAPEQARGEAVDVRADVFALCATAFELLAGRRPHDAVTARELQSQKEAGRFDPLPRGVAPRAVLDVIHAGLAPNPAERPASAAAVCKVFEAALTPRRVAVVPWVTSAILVGAGAVVWFNAEGACADEPSALWTEARAAAAVKAWPDDAGVERASSALSTFERGWRGEWAAACDAEESASRECLALQHAWVDASVDAHVAGEIPADFVLADIPSVAHCRGQGPLVLRRLPGTTTARAERLAVRSAVAQAWDARLEGRTQEAYDGLIALQPKAAALGDAWVSAELHHALGEASFVLDLHQDADAALGHAVESASASEHTVIAVRAQLLRSTLASKAGDLELERARLDAAAVAVRRAEGTPMHGRLMAMLDAVEAEVALRRGDLETARARLGGAIDHARLHAPERLAERLGDLGEIEAAAGNFALAVAHYREALASLPEGPEVHLAREVLELNFAGVLIQGGDLDAALAHTRASMQLAMTRPDGGRPSFEAWANEVSILVLAERFEEAGDSGARMLAALEDADDPPVQLRLLALRQAAEIAGHLKDYAACDAQIAALRSEPEFEIDTDSGVNAQLIQSSCTLAMGEHVRALDLATGAVATAARVPETPTLLALAHGMRADVLIAMESFERAFEETDAALGALPGADPWSMRPYLQTLRARALWGLGRHDEARTLARATIDALDGEAKTAFADWMQETEH